MACHGTAGWGAWLQLQRYYFPCSTAVLVKAGQEASNNMAGGRKRKRAALKRGAAVDLPQQQRHQGAPGGAVQAGDDGAGPSAAAAAAAPLVVAKRLEVFTRQQIVAAALANDADMLQRALGMPDGDPRKAACYKRRATRPFKGCRPIDAAVIANAAAAIRVLTSVVDPNSAVREKFDGKGLRAAFPYLDLQQRTCAVRAPASACLCPLPLLQCLPAIAVMLCGSASMCA